MRKLLLIAAFIVLLAFAGCARPSVTIDAHAVAATQDAAAHTPELDNDSGAAPPTLVQGVKREYALGYDASFIPSRGVGTRGLTIDHFAAGDTFNVPFQILNGRDGDKIVHYRLRIPVAGELEDRDNSRLPEEYLSWFAVTEGDVLIKSGSLYEVAIPMSVPKGETLSPGTYELRASVKDVTHPGFITIAPEVTWFVVISQ